MDKDDHGHVSRADRRRKAAPSPRRRWRELLHSLPRYSGPYSVGMMEIEVPVREPRTFSHIKRNHAFALRLDTILYSIYYPCELDEESESEKLYRPLWLPAPRVPTCKGYAKFLSVPHMPVTAYIAMTTMFTRLPAYRNAKLASHRPEELSTLDDTKNDPDSHPESKVVYPVVMFSHGLGASRTCLSTICGELASNGLIVVAVEHRDGSGARSYVNVPPSGACADGQMPKEMHAKNHYVVDYLFPKDNPLDTAPHNEQGVDTELRNAQIEMRLAEIEEAYHSLEMINIGLGERVSESNLRKKGNMGSSSHGLEGIDWSDWTGRLYLQNVTAMGHSFGGATIVQITRQADRFPWVGQGILLDAWGPATPVLGEATRERLRKPLLIICSEAFMHWQENFNRMTSICQEVRDSGSCCWMLTIKGSTHLSWTDFALLYSRLMSFLWKTMVNPRRAIHLTVSSVSEFLKQVLPAQQTLATSLPDEGILGGAALSPEESLPHENRPDDKWIAARLKIPQESRVRFQTWYRRRLARSSRASKVPRDDRGRPLWGVMQYDSGHEIWIHANPMEENRERS